MTGHLGFVIEHLAHNDRAAIAAFGLNNGVIFRRGRNDVDLRDHI